MVTEFVTVWNVMAKSHRGVELRFQVAAETRAEALEMARNFAFDEERQKPLPTSTEFFAMKAIRAGLPVSILVRH